MVEPHSSGGNDGSFVRRGGLWVILQSLLLAGVAITPFASRSAQRHSLLLAMGCLCLIIGAVIGRAGALVLKNALTPFPKPLSDARLIRHGIYAHIRHPLYTSVMLSAMGWALAWQSWPSFWLALALVPFFMAKANYEERFLREQFPEYPEYSRTTKRFIPWLY